MKIINRNKLTAGDIKVGESFVKYPYHEHDRYYTVKDEPYPDDGNMRVCINSSNSMIWMDKGTQVERFIPGRVVETKLDDGLEDLDPELHMVYSEKLNQFGFVDKDGDVLTMSGCFLYPHRPEGLKWLRDNGFFRIKKPTTVEVV